MIRITNIAEAKANLSSLIRQVRESGEPVIIGRAGEPVAVLTAYSQNPAPRQLVGSWEGKVRLKGDFAATDREIAGWFRKSELFPDDSAGSETSKPGIE